MSLYDLAVAQRWAITIDALRAILEISSRETLDPELARLIRDDRASRPSALAAQAGRPLDGARHAVVRDRVALMDITGPIVRRADLFSEISGATSVDALARDFRLALDDPGVDSILLTIDSPGGEITGVNELANMIYAARGTKPIRSYVEGLGASAAYWIGSAADQVIADDTAALGSIGVAMAVPDPSKRSAKDVEIVSSQSPNKRPDVTTERGRALLQTIVDDSAAVFVSAVARNRGVSEQTVLDNYGAGGLLIGQHAVDAGLADRLGSFESTLADMRQLAMDSKRPRLAANGGSMQVFSKEWWANLFAAQAEQTGDPTPPASGAGDPAAILAVPPALLAAGPQTDPALLEQIRILRGQLAETQAQAQTARSVAWADGAIRDGRALPAEREQLIALHTRAQQDDAASPADRVAQLETLIATRPAHALTAEAVPAGDGGMLTIPAPARARQPMTAERRKQLLGYTPVGQTILSNEK